jgi:hypothetical protein
MINSSALRVRVQEQMEAEPATTSGLVDAPVLGSRFPHLSVRKFAILESDVRGMGE